MIQMLALEINENTYHVAAGFLGGGFLAVPEKDTYGCIVVINQITTPVQRPTNSRGPRVMYAGPRRFRDDRTISFENTWFERETFDAEYDVNGTTGGFISFWDITRKPEAEIQKYYAVKAKEAGHCIPRECQCDGECDYCHGEDD